MELENMRKNAKKEIRIGEPERITFEGVYWKKAIAATGQVYYL